MYTIWSIKYTEQLKGRTQTSLNERRNSTELTVPFATAGPAWGGDSPATRSHLNPSRGQNDGIKMGHHKQSKSKDWGSWSTRFSSTFMRTTWCHIQGAHNLMCSLIVIHMVICVIHHSESYRLLTCLKAWRTSWRWLKWRNSRWSAPDTSGG